MKMNRNAAGNVNWLEIWKSTSALYLSHPFQNKIYDEVSAAIDFGGLDTMIAVIGPTRVGKSSVIQRVLSEKAARDYKGKIKIIYAQAKKGKGNAVQEYKRLASSILEAAEYPGFYIGSETGKDRLKVVSNLKTTSADTMWAMVKRICKEYAMTFIVIDEAHLLVPGKENSSLLETQMTELKKLAEINETKVILTGGYKAVNIFINDEHANGRSEIYHFRPYGSDVQSKKAFNNLLKAYDKLIPIRSEHSSLRDFFAIIWNECLGNVGLLKQYIARLCKIAYSLNKTHVDSEVIELAKAPDSTRDIALSEYQIGETFFGNLGLNIERSGKIGRSNKSSSSERRSRFVRKQVSTKKGNREIE